MKGLLVKFLTFWYVRVVYRKQAYGEVCCCGKSMWIHVISDGETYKACRDMQCPSRCAKEYAVTSAVNNKLKSLGVVVGVAPITK